MSMFGPHAVGSRGSRTPPGEASPTKSYETRRTLEISSVPAKAGRVLVQATRLTRELCGLLTAGIHQD